MQVTAKTLIRVAAISMGVFNGVDGDIVVCDPEGTDPLARYPRIKAQDAKAGVMAGLISLTVDPAAFNASEDEGDRHANAMKQVSAEVDEVDLTALAHLESAMRGDKIVSDPLARPVTAADLVDVTGAIVPAAAGADQSGTGEGDGSGKDDRGVASKHIAGGRYEITAPWLDEPIKVQGKPAAEAEVERLIAEGPPPSE